MNNQTNQVYVISMAGKPLMPTKRFGKVRHLLQSGKAKVVTSKPFTIQLQYETSEYVQPLTLGIDPGTSKIAVAVRDGRGKIFHAEELSTRNREVTENMQERKRHRQSRRRHRRNKLQRRAQKDGRCFVAKKYQIAGAKEAVVCKLIKPKLSRFNNRKRSDKWQTPTGRHLYNSHVQLVKNIQKILPIRRVCLEYSKFDIHKLKNPEVAGVAYQQGTQQGYTNAQEYVLCRDQHTCQRCAKTQVQLQVHHVIWRRNGGSDTPENLITLCAKCHDLVHRRAKVDSEVKQLFAGIKKIFAPTTMLNSIMPSFHAWLREQFGDDLTITYGYQTKAKRQKMKLPKQHWLDAYLIACVGMSEIPELGWQNVPVLQSLQFRRHHRQIIHATRERNYKLGNKIVAQNRHKRSGQATDSLAEFVETNGRKRLCEVRVLPGKKVLRSGFKGIGKGDVVYHDGKRCVVKGYGQMGRQVGFVNHKNYVATSSCQLRMRNTGIVML